MDMGILYQAGQRAVMDGDIKSVRLKTSCWRRRKSADMNRLLAFKRSLVHVRRAVGPQREIFNQLTPLSSPRQTMSRTWKPPSNNSAQSAWI
jgi:hypothetical protein